MQTKSTSMVTSQKMDTRDHERDPLRTESIGFECSFTHQTDNTHALLIGIVKKPLRYFSYFINRILMKLKMAAIFIGSAQIQ